MSDVFANASRVPTADGAPDPYDHEINLVDTTAPEATAEVTRTRTDSPSGSWHKLGIARVPTRSSVKTSLTKRKYAKYQESRYNKGKGVAAEGRAATSTPPNGVTEAVDFAREGSGTPQEHKKKQHQKQEYAIDVLYENQRGSFLFGIPLYSHSSLLNFDPSPWVNREFKDSPVNITNAQVPDPSWEWTWKTWYVDMSCDVDEEGWQYSFSFGKSTAWHGTHPWFHSFVRRRRWLRKRVKRAMPMPGALKASNMSAAHKLTAEYFTIHPKRDRSRSPDSARPQSYVSILPATEFEEPPQEITDIATLLKSLRLASIDRAKIDLVKRFVASAPADELSYLGPHIPDIMSHLVFQNSRRQLLSFLKLSAEEAQQHRDQHESDSRPESPDESRRIDNLLAAIEEADKEIVGLEYWSDRKHILKTADPERETTRAIAAIFDAPALLPKDVGSVAGNIKGISKDAEIGRDGTREVAQAAGRGGRGSDDSAATGTFQDASAKPQSKGKQRRRSSEDDDYQSINDVESPRLKTDQVLIPD